MPKVVGSWGWFLFLKAWIFQSQFVLPVLPSLECLLHGTAYKITKYIFFLNCTSVCLFYSLKNVYTSFQMPNRLLHDIKLQQTIYQCNWNYEGCLDDCFRGVHKKWDVSDSAILDPHNLGFLKQPKFQYWYGISNWVVSEILFCFCSTISHRPL